MTLADPPPFSAPHPATCLAWPTSRPSRPPRTPATAHNSPCTTPHPPPRRPRQDHLHPVSSHRFPSARADRTGALTRPAYPAIAWTDTLGSPGMAESMAKPPIVRARTSLARNGLRSFPLRRAGSRTMPRLDSAVPTPPPIAVTSFRMFILGARRQRRHPPDRPRRLVVRQGPIRFSVAQLFSCPTHLPVRSHPPRPRGKPPRRPGESARGPA